MSLCHSTSRTYSRKTSAFQVKQRRRNTQSTSRIPKTPTPQRQTNSSQNSQVEQHRHQSLSASRHGNCSQFRKGLSYLQLCCSPSIRSAMTLLRLDSGTCKGAAHIRKHRKLWHCKGIKHNLAIPNIAATCHSTCSHDCSITTHEHSFVMPGEQHMAWQT